MPAIVCWLLDALNVDQIHTVPTFLLTINLQLGGHTLPGLLLARLVVIVPMRFVVQERKVSNKRYHARHIQTLSVHIDAVRGIGIVF